MPQKRVDQIFSILAEKFPNPRIELSYRNPYTLLVAVMLSAQSTDRIVNKVTEHLFDLAPSPENMLKLGENELKKHIKSIGLYNTKASNIIAMTKKILIEFNGEVPDTLQKLVSLPGIGRKSANVVLNVIYNQPTIAVDTHVLRVANRLSLCETKKPKDTELALLKIIPQRWLKNAHILLVLHGRYVCQAKKAHCTECALRNICSYNKPNQQS